jgi:anaerobilin synthase
MRCLTRCTQTAGTGEVACAVARELTLAWICRALQTRPQFSRNASAAPAHVSESSRQRVETLLVSAPPSVDADAILAGFDHLPGEGHLEGRRLPPPPWALRPFELDGADCLRALQVLLDQRSGPLSVYLHVPFCDRHCGFCDCLAHRLRPSEHSAGGDLVAGLVAQLESWNRDGRLSRRPVTTVHLGGGTPGLLSPQHFARLVTAMREHLGITSRTEWAIETTGSLLVPDVLGRLAAQGFTRLHVGVQTLEPEVRRRIGRRLTATEILARLRAAQAAGFVTSVDLVFGLPGESLAGFAAGIEALGAAGTSGFSLYALNRSARNAKFLLKAATLPNAIDHYVFFQVGEQMLARLGYQKNHFTHYARSEDRNLYFRHRLRGEDLVAFGPTADGVVGNLCYRNLDWPEWATRMADQTGLAGGLRESRQEAAVSPITTALMCGTVYEAPLHALGGESLLRSWLRAGLVLPADKTGAHLLTANGSWLIGEMLAAVQALGERVDCPTVGS